MRRAHFFVVVSTLICQLRPVASDESSPIVQLPAAGVDLEVDAPQGYCLKTTGPWREKVQISAAAERLGAWTSEQILCLADLDLPEASFKVSPAPRPAEGESGQFGFGPKVGVNLRPRISTSALWPLQANTPTLGISFKDQAARVVALQATLNNKVVLEMPMVAARFRRQWAIDVQAMNDTTSCQAEGVVGSSRIACRFDTTSSLVQLVVFCRPCALRNARMQITGGGPHQETSEPWIGLSSSGESQWVVVVTDVIDGQEKVHEFVVAAVRGHDEVQWKESSSQRYTRLIGTALLQVTFFVVVALLLLPAPCSSAARSSAAAAALALPYLAQLAQLEDAPILLKSAFASWPFSGAEDGWRSVWEVFAVLLGVVILHGCAAMLFLRENGPGSAEMMPHSLSFGAWELRGASYVALPLAAAASRIAENSVSAGSLFQLFCGGLGLAILLSLFALPWKVLQTLRTWFQEGRVVCLQHPADGRTQYVDRVCDQLSACPVRRRSRLLGSWLDASSWQSTAAVAMIQEVEHHGTCKERGGEHWDRNWSAGPWQPLLPHQSSTGSAPTPISEGLRHRPVSVDSAEPLIKSGWKSPKAGSGAPSALLSAHPVTVTTRFCFAERHGFAGVCGLPWLDAAVPAAELPLLERAVPQIHLRVQARQLSGPFTSGSLSACFDSANRKPWWWSYDFFIKVLAGCLVTVAEASAERHWLRIAWLSILTLLALWVLYTRPHVHWVENLVAISAASALPGGTAFYLYGNELVEHRQKAVLALLVLGYLPTLVALVVCLYSYKITKDQDLPENVIGWGELSGHRLGYERLSVEEDDAQNVGTGRAEIDLYSAVAVLITSEGSKAPRIRIPCEVKLPLRPVHLWMKGAIAVSSSLTDRQIQVAVPAELLGHASNPENPWATVLTPDGGLLLYRDQETNGGLKWQQVLRHFLRGRGAVGEALLREAESRLLQEERLDSLAALEILES